MLTTESTDISPSFIAPIIYLLVCPSMPFDHAYLPFRYALDIIGSVAFGIEPNTLENPDNAFRVMEKRVNNGETLNVIRQTLIFLYPGYVYNIISTKHIPYSNHLSLSLSGIYHLSAHLSMVLWGLQMQIFCTWSCIINMQICHNNPSLNGLRYDRTTEDWLTPTPSNNQWKCHYHSSNTNYHVYVTF